MNINKDQGPDKAEWGQGEGNYLHRQMIGPEASPPSPGPFQAPPPKKRKLFWPLFLAVLLTASLTFVLTASAGYLFYGDAIRASMGSRPGQTTDPSQPKDPEAVKDGFTLTFTDEEGLEEALDKFKTV